MVSLTIDPEDYLIVHHLQEEGEYSRILYINKMKERLEAEIELLKAENARLREALEFILEARQEIDVATIPKAGIDHAPEQVVVNFSCSYLRLMKAREALKGVE